jgi:hypothetical protein
VYPIFHGNIFYLTQHSSLVSIDFALPSQNKIKKIEVRWACRPGHWSFTTAPNPTSKKIFREPLTNLTTVTWWNSVVSKPCVQTRIEVHIQYTTQVFSKRIKVITYFRKLPRMGWNLKEFKPSTMSTIYVATM